MSFDCCHQNSDIKYFNIHVNIDTSSDSIELNLTLPSTTPSLQLRWLQHPLSYAPELFINDVIIKGISSDDDSVKKQKTNCKLDKVIDFNVNG